jgi:hypothetical protein
MKHIEMALLAHRQLLSLINDVLSEYLRIKRIPMLLLQRVVLLRKHFKVGVAQDSGFALNIFEGFFHGS